jgi:hypothetical protein
VYVLAHILATLFFNLTNFIYPQFAYGKGFIDAVLAPGIAAYYSLSLPLSLFEKAPKNLHDANRLEYSDTVTESRYANLPVNVLGLAWLCALGVFAGFNAFNNSWSALIAAIVSGLVIAYNMHE